MYHDEAPLLLGYERRGDSSATCSAPSSDLSTQKRAHRVSNTRFVWRALLTRTEQTGVAWSPWSCASPERGKCLGEFP